MSIRSDSQLNHITMRLEHRQSQHNATRHKTTGRGAAHNPTRTGEFILSELVAKCRDEFNACSLHDRPLVHGTGALQCVACVCVRAPTTYVINPGLSVTEQPGGCKKSTCGASASSAHLLSPSPTAAFPVTRGCAESRLSSRVRLLLLPLRPWSEPSQPATHTRQTDN